MGKEVQVDQVTRMGEEVRADEKVAQTDYEDLLNPQVENPSGLEVVNRLMEFLVLVDHPNNFETANSSITN